MHARLRLVVIGLAIAIMVGPVVGLPANAKGAAEAGFAHPEWFADVAWLQERLEDDDLAVVALTPAEKFVAGYIPGAAQIDWKAVEVVEKSDASVAEWKTDVEATLTGLGIERSDTVVVMGVTNMIRSSATAARGFIPGLRKRNPSGVETGA